jgi:hypothetical protein
MRESCFDGATLLHCDHVDSLAGHRKVWQDMT